MPKLIEDARHRASAPSHDGEGASPRPTEPSRARCRARAKTLLTILAALVLAPLTVVVGMGIPGNGYYLSGTLIVLYAIVPFFVAFEGRRPTAREIAVVAVLTALAVAARAAFVWVPHFKPMAAIIMIAGIAAGPQTGFLVGSVAALASNFIFGQGPWTPWQMLAFGVVGLVAGFVLIVGLAGPVLDTSTVFYLSTAPTPELAATVYLAGLPVNAIHGAATALTLLVVANTLLDQLDRVRVKYGLLNRSR